MPASIKPVYTLPARYEIIYLNFYMNRGLEISHLLDVTLYNSYLCTYMILGCKLLESRHHVLLILVHLHILI